MTLRTLEEIISEVSLLAAEEFDSVIRHLNKDEAFRDHSTWKAYIKLELCEELGLTYQSWCLAAASHIVDKMKDLLDKWECEGFFGFQLYSQSRFSDSWLDRIRCEAKMWVSREMLSRIRGAA